MKTTLIHPTAIISPEAQIAPDVSIGAYVVIEGKVQVHSGTSIGALSVITGKVSIGKDCQISSQVAIGHPPQDLSYQGEETEVKIGDRVSLREFVTVQRGTVRGGGITSIEDDCFLMNYAHIGHDCSVGAGSILANNATLGGHVKVGNKVNMSAMFMVHQFVHIGDFSMLAGLSGTRKSVPPYVVVDGRPARIWKTNRIGLQRNGFSPEEMKAIEMAYRLLRKQEIKLALEEIDQEAKKVPVLANITGFYREAERGIIPFYSVNKDETNEETDL